MACVTTRHATPVESSTMKSVLLSMLLGIVCSIAANAACALDFKSIGATPAIFYDAPADKGRKVFVAPRGMPVEVVLSYGEWTKVRDAAGDLAWVQAKALSSKRTVIVSVTNLKVRAAAEETATALFSADRGVLLELAEPVASGWLKVRHRDGQSGYVKATDVWGD
jgi:Bacterial SH3 domain